MAAPRHPVGGPPAAVFALKGRLALAVGLYDFLKKMGIDPAQPMPGKSVQ
jgi:hypothetical protein